MIAQEQAGMASSKSSATNQLYEKMSDAVHSVQEMGGLAKEFAHEKFEEVRDNVGESAARYYEQGRTKAKELEQTLEGIIRERPLKAIMIAVGIGLILGGLAIRR